MSRRPAPLLEELADRLGSLRAQSRLRELKLGSGIDFSSNDYLGLSADTDFAEAFRKRCAVLSGTDLLAPASRLLRGHLAVHRDFERRFARFKGNKAALLFASGFQANLGLLSSLVRRGDRVLSDEFNHASLIDGLRLSGCRRRVFRHCSVDHVRDFLKTPHPAGRTFLVTESLFSMEGDIAPLADYAELARAGSVELIVDDAHATGLYGPRGAGLVAREGIQSEVLATTSTLGKSLALSGGIVSGSQVLIDFLVNHSRSFIFSTSVPPLLVAALETSLDLVTGQPERRRRLHDNARFLRRQLSSRGVESLGNDSPIVAVVVGDCEAAVNMARRLQADGLDVRAIRPPTVPEGGSRLRISVHSSHSRSDLDRLADCLACLFDRADTKGVGS